MPVTKITQKKIDNLWDKCLAKDVEDSVELFDKQLKKANVIRHHFNNDRDGQDAVNEAVKIARDTNSLLFIDPCYNDRNVCSDGFVSFISVPKLTVPEGTSNAHEQIKDLLSEEGSIDMGTVKRLVGTDDPEKAQEVYQTALSEWLDENE
jgi:hypothetical protein